MKLLIIVLAMVATGAGAAHSWYSKTLYVEAAVLSQAYSVADQAKKSVSDYFLETGFLPNNNEVSGLMMSDLTIDPIIAGVSILPGGVVSIDFEPRNGRRTIAFVPTVNPTNGFLFWRCESSTVNKFILEKLRPVCSYKSKGDTDAMISAILNRDDRAVKAELSDGVDVNGRIYGVTPLMVAVSTGSTSIAELLLDAGADIDLRAKNFHGHTALMLSALGADADLMRLLLSRTASVLKLDNDERDVYDYAAAENDRSGTEILTKAINAQYAPIFVADN